MAVRKSAGMRSKRGPARKGDGMSTTPTVYGERSPDYVKQSGDPDWMRSYSEEQIGLMGGRSRMMEKAAASEQRAADRAAGVASDPFTDPAETVPNQDSVISMDEPGITSPGPTTPPTTYGVGEMPMPGKAGAPGQVKKLTGAKAATGKGKLLKRIAKTTGTTRGEAKGIMKKARKQVRTGNKAGAKRTITRALSGGPRAGVKGSPQRTQKAQAAATKITKRIATRQQQAAPRRRKK